MVVSAYSRPLSWRENTKHRKWDQGKEQRCAECKWWEADVWCAGLFLGQLKHRLGVFWLLWRLTKQCCLTLGGVRCLLVSNTTAEHAPVGQLSHNLFTKRAERGNQAEEPQNHKLLFTHSDKMCLSWCERWCPYPVTPQHFSGSGQWEKSAVPWWMPKS